VHKQKSIGIIGAGSIAEAMLDGILDEGILLPENIYITNKSNDDRLEFFRESYGVNTTRDYKEILSKCRYLIIAVKPADIGELLAVLKKWVTMNHIIITLAAGITTEFVETSLGKKIQVIRAMPNTSCKIKESATAIALGRNAKKEASDFAKEIFSSIGKVSTVEESMMDAVTGLSGSGPAYVYLLMEAMVEAGVKVGLPRSLSEELTIQTVCGAAKMALNSGESPKILRKKITTPGGTTMAAMKVLENANFTGAFIEAVESATKRSRELMTQHSSLHKFRHVL
jgi:pyrroline-5-carboxylate reductase